MKDLEDPATFTGRIASLAESLFEADSDLQLLIDVNGIDRETALAIFCNGYHRGVETCLKLVGDEVKRVKS